MNFKRFLILAFILIAGNASALDWETVEAQRVIDNEHVFLKDDRVIKIIGFDGPDLDFPTLQERSSARKTFQLLKHLLVGKQIKILKDAQDCVSGIYPRHIKTLDGNYVVEKMLEQGLGRFEGDEVNVHFDEKYRKAEETAKANRLGQWGETSWQKSSRKIRDIAGVSTLSWRKKFGQYLAPISTGRVELVRSGNEFVLENGLCVKLLGVETPPPTSIRRAHSCFGQLAKSKLQELILNKKVELRRDISQLDKDRCLVRHVWLPGEPDKLNSSIHINRLMVEDGYGRANIRQENKKYKTLFSRLQDSVYKSPRGAWSQCAREIISEKGN